MCSLNPAFAMPSIESPVQSYIVNLNEKIDYIATEQIKQGEKLASLIEDMDFLRNDIVIAKAFIFGAATFGVTIWSLTTVFVGVDEINARRREREKKSKSNE